jgi:hypothetical protein
VAQFLLRAPTLPSWKIIRDANNVRELSKSEQEHIHRSSRAPEANVEKGVR